jgi:hypothetical protein
MDDDRRSRSVLRAEGMTVTDAALRRAGFPVSLTIIKDHDHSYTDAAPPVNRAAWEFLEQIDLAQPPVFETYRSIVRSYTNRGRCTVVCRANPGAKLSRS